MLAQIFVRRELLVSQRSTESRDHDGLGGERVAQRRSQQLCDRIREELETIAGVKMEAGFSGHVPGTISQAVGQKLSD
jgi:hypothetical protein